MLTTNQIEHFKKEGFTIVREAAPASLLEELRAVTEEWVEESRGVRASDDKFVVEPDHSSENPRLQRINHPVAHHSLFWEVATSAKVLDPVAELIGENLKFHHSKLNLKASGGGAGIGWHQDFAFFPHTNFDLVACGIALDDSTQENGCLMAVPGSHRFGILTHRDSDGEFVGQITSSPELFRAGTSAPVELQAGDISIHHVCLIHGSSENHSRRPRRLLIFEYAACDAIPLDYRPPANEYAGRVVRGVPATHARLAGALSLPLRGEIDGNTSIFDRQKAAGSVRM